ncbi:hypothetical protein [Rhizobium oryzicola]|uniref:Uncharacterized protein n=1 Tax=Rhizobium oryzicola TaxID=1232668 RepID=A0ABT8SVI8_9HYPH|nr:hypothetical protein [Rhizobium oryzicola]MDO1582435.1 hypothetical protein [Rhizobium oryzicola]
MPQIDVSGLTATGGVSLVTLDVTVPTVTGELPYLTLGAVEIWASSTNDRATAAKAGETAGRQFVHSNLPSGVNTRYYWSRARNVAGTVGSWFPASATAGVAGTTLATAPGANSVGTDQLQDGAVTTNKVASIAASKIVADSLSAISANLGTVTAGTVTGALVRTSSGSTRVELDYSSNALNCYLGGSFVGRFGGSFSIDPVLYITGGSAGIAVSVSTSGTAGQFTNSGSSSDSHGLRASSGGGMGLVGIASGGGGYAFYAERGSYGPFTGAHDAMLAKAAEIDFGDIVCDVRVLARGGIDDTLTEVTRSTQRGQPAVVGVLTRRAAYDPVTYLAGLPSLANERDETSSFLRQKLAERFDRVTINALGEGQINVCGRGGDIAAGDFIIASDLPGKGERQPDDVFRATTVAKAREAVTFSSSDEVKRVACIYMCG